MSQLTLFNTQPASYHNTVPLSGIELAAAEAKAETQEAEILELFIRHKRLTPWQAEARMQAIGKRYPITSIRRAITNLTEQGRLVKAGYQITGPLGSKENVWEIK